MFITFAFRKAMLDLARKVFWLTQYVYLQPTLLMIGLLLCVVGYQSLTSSFIHCLIFLLLQVSDEKVSNLKVLVFKDFSRQQDDFSNFYCFLFDPQF